MKKIYVIQAAVFLLVICLLVISLAAAIYVPNTDIPGTGTYYTNKQFPPTKIVLRFNRSATVNYVTLLDNMSKPIGLNKFSVSDDLTTHKYTPIKNLDEGRYQIKLNATDVFGNPLEAAGGIASIPFVIDRTPPWLAFYDPDEFLVYTDSWLNFGFTFNEPVMIANLTLKDHSGNIVGVFYHENFTDLNENYPGLFEKNTAYDLFTYTQPPDGYYSYIINYYDYAENPNSKEVDFIINARPIGITLAYPKEYPVNAVLAYGVADKSVFDLVVETDEPGYCKFLISTGTVKKIVNFGTEGSEFLERASYTTNHTVKGFSLATVSPKNLYVTCKGQLGDMNEKQFIISYDSTKPEITVYADPNPVVEYSQTTNLKIGSDDIVQCRYTNNSNVVFKDMTKYITPYNEDNYNYYKANHSQTFTFNVAQVNQTYGFPFYVQCINPAGWVSDKKFLLVSVNLNAGLVITRISPERWLRSGTGVELYVKTNKNADCSYKRSNETSYNNVMSATGAKDHKQVIGTFVNGEYSYDVSCEGYYAGQHQQAALTLPFGVDSTAPIIKNVTVNTIEGIVCTTDKLAFNVTTQVNLAPVREYSYYILNMNNQSKTPIMYENGDEADCVNHTCKAYITAELSSEDEMPVNTSYVLRVRATGANNVSSSGEVQSNGFLVDPVNSNCVDTTPPRVGIIPTYYDGYTIVNMTCTDAHKCSRLLYCAVPTDKTCAARTNYTKSFKIDGTSIIFYYATDGYGNTVYGNETVNVTTTVDHCDNKAFDPDKGETYVDCGGTCKPCGSGEPCKIDKDCDLSKELWCDPEFMRCTLCTCDDDAMNCYETGVDCGGTACPACELGAIGEACASDPVCKSKCCSKLTSTCQASACGDNTYNCNETDKDCGGPYCDPCGLGKACLTGDDCESGICKNYVCVEAPEEWGLFKILLFVIGILIILTGLTYMGYIYYLWSEQSKRAKPEMPAKAVPPPAMPTAGAPAARRPTPEDIRRRQLMERRGMFERFARERKPAAEIRKEVTKEIKKEEAVKAPEVKEAKKAPAEEWISIEKLAKKEAKPAEEKKEEKKYDPFEALSELIKSKKTFEDMSDVVKKAKAAGKEEEVLKGYEEHMKELEELSKKEVVSTQEIIKKGEKTKKKFGKMIKEHKKRPVSAKKKTIEEIAAVGAEKDIFEKLSDMAAEKIVSESKKAADQFKDPKTLEKDFTRVSKKYSKDILKKSLTQAVSGMIKKKKITKKAAKETIDRLFKKKYLTEEDRKEIKSKLNIK